LDLENYQMALSYVKDIERIDPEFRSLDLIYLQCEAYLGLQMYKKATKMYRVAIDKRLKMQEVDKQSVVEDFLMIAKCF